MPEPKRFEEYEGRLSAAEVRILGITTTLDEIKESVDRFNSKLESGISKTELSLVESQRRLEARMETLSTEFAKSQRTPWGTLASWAAILITIVTVYASIQSAERYQDRNEINALINKLENRVHSLELDDTRVK